MKSLLLSLTLCISLAVLCQCKQYFIISNESGGWDCGALAAAIQAKLNAGDTVAAFCGQSNPPTDLSSYDGVLTWLNGQSIVNPLIEQAVTNYILSRRGMVVIAQFSLQWFSSTFLSTYCPVQSQNTGFWNCFGASVGSCAMTYTAPGTVFTQNVAWNAGGYYHVSDVTLAASSRQEIAIYNSYYSRTFTLAASRQLSNGGVTAYINTFPFDNFPDAGVQQLYADALSLPYPTGNVPNCAVYAGLNCQQCSPGYTLSADGSTCQDVNECTASATTCPFGSTCTNTPGSYVCSNYWYFFMSQETNYVLDIVGQGVPLVMNPMKNSSFQNQLWQFTPEGYLINYQTGMVADINGGRVFAGTNVILWTKKSLDQATNQLWQYSSSSSNIQVTSDSSLILDVYQGNKAPGTPLIIWYQDDPSSYPGNQNQLWNLVVPTTYP